MKKSFATAVFVFALFATIPCFGTLVLSEPLPGGYFDAEYFAGPARKPRFLSSTSAATAAARMGLGTVGWHTNRR